VIDYLRLAFGTVVVLLPGVAVARAFGRRSTSASLSWGLVCVFVAWAAVFVLHRSIHLAVVVLLVLVAAAALVSWRRRGSRRDHGSRAWGSRGSVWLVGVVLGWFLWHVEGPVVGDGLFHEARVRKLADLTSLHLTTVDEFKDGGLHPGYAFPLWHGFLALVSWFSGLDPEQVVRHEPSLLAPIACLVAWEAGVAVFGSRWAGASIVAFSLAVFCFGPGNGGSYATLALPGTAARQLLVPAAIALFFTASSRRGYFAVAVVFGAITLTHPTYALFLLLPLVATLAWRARAYAAAVVPAAAVLLWLKPVVDETVAQDPGKSENARALSQYADQLVITNAHHFRLAPEVLGRSGSVAVASLVLLPLCAFAIRRRWAAYAFGGSLLVIVLMEVPWLFVHFSDAVSLSQSRRAAGFAPLAFALVGVLALLARTWLVVPAALVAGIVLQILWPGDFELGLHHGGPALATWIALVGGLAALGAALARRPLAAQENYGLGAVAALCFVLPVFVHGVLHWSPSPATDPHALSPRLVHRLRTVVPEGAIVLADLQTSYHVAAVAPVYIVAAPVTHVANTTKNLPYVRRKAVKHWILTKDPRVAERYGATWAIRSGRLYRLPR
jgi:hypothetical protein